MEPMEWRRWKYGKSELRKYVLYRDGNTYFRKDSFHPEEEEAG
jgi:hypothetical protein